MDLPRLLLLAMLFIGATYCDEGTILAMGFRDRLDAKTVLYHRARLLFHADWERDETVLIQAVFLMSFWRGGPADVRDVRYWLGVVITLSESYGLHRSFDLANKEDAKQETPKSRIRDQDCDMDPLSPADLDESDAAAAAAAADSALFGPCLPEHVTYTIKMVELAKLLGRVLDLHFAPGTNGSSADHHVRDLDCALETWKDSLPESMRCATDEGGVSVWTRLLHLAYNHLRILIHRNSFLRHGASDANHVVTAAACRISRIAEDMSTQGTLRYGQMHLITSLFAALCIHVISIRRGTGVSRRIAEHRAQMCLLCLKEIQKYWRINNNVLDLFLRYLDRSIADRLHAADVDAQTSTACKASRPGKTEEDPFVGANEGSASAVVPSPRPDQNQDQGQQRRVQGDLDLFQDQYLGLANGYWEGDDALGDLGSLLQADDGDDFSGASIGLNLLGRSL
ncbi:hypothetical protein E4U41_003966 [Claviceps citrina]|nr:hypothetical protein E4U41_003966 [Claviceps citrina]